MLVRLVMAAAVILSPGPVVAQVNCGAEPHDVPVEVQEELKGDVQGKAQLFTRLLGEAQLQGAVDATRRELNEKHRDIDQSQLDRYMLWTTCQAILADRTLTPQEKIDQYLRVYKVLRPDRSESDPEPDFSLAYDKRHTLISVTQTGVAHNVDLTYDALFKLDCGVLLDTIISRQIWASRQSGANLPIFFFTSS